MAPELKQKKRKGAEDTTISKKKRKSEKPTAKATTVDATTTIDQDNPAIQLARITRKRASDFFDAEKETTGTPAQVVQESKPKKAKLADAASASKKSSAKPAKAQSTPAAPPKEVVEETAEDDVWADSDDDDVADQSAALLEGFGSSDEEDVDETDGITEVPSVPSGKELSKKLKLASKNDADGPGVVYVGRVPHGFYEHQMRAYFSQFGEITRLRLSRNKKTGHSKHYAFIEFASREVAKIVAATMNKYLLFGHILQVRTLAPEEVHPELFKGANKRFKVVPRNRIQGRQLRLPKEREVWEKRIENENKRRKDKEEKLKMLGYEYKAPDLITTKAIPFRSQNDADAGVGAQLIEDIPVEQAKAQPTPKLTKEKASKSLTKEEAGVKSTPKAKAKASNPKSKGKVGK